MGYGIDRTGSTADAPVYANPCACMPKLSAYILTFNEAEKIKAAVESVLWADEIVVADSNSADATAAIATSLSIVGKVSLPLL